MKLHFYKMQGAGNDYVYFDGFAQDLPSPEPLAIALSNRNFGIGGDGIIYVLPSKVADGRMRMFNADGSEGSMCGNGVRCVGKLLRDLSYAKSDTVTVETLSGIKMLTLQRDREQNVSGAMVDMGKAVLRAADIPVITDLPELINHPVRIGGQEVAITCVSMGNPHCVIFTSLIDALDLPRIGPVYENDPMFPARVNTEFVEVLSPTHLRMRVWERGSGETLACGTGACASVVAATLCGHCARDTDVRIDLRGGTLTIRYTQDGTVYMTGPAVTVFEGDINIPAH